YRLLGDSARGDRIRDTPRRTTSAVAGPFSSNCTCAHSASSEGGGSSLRDTSITGSVASGRCASGSPPDVSTVIRANHGGSGPRASGTPGEIIHGKSGVVNSTAARKFDGMAIEPGSGSRRRISPGAMAPTSPGPYRDTGTVVSRPAARTTSELPANAD